MKMKSVLASLGACAIALSAMAVSASAAVWNTTGSGNYSVPLDGIDVTKIDKIVAEVACDTNYLKGTIGYNDTTSTGENKWKNHGPKTEGENGYFDSSAEDGKTVESDVWEWDAKGTVEAGSKIEVQFWWINPHYNEDGTEGDKGIGYVNSVKLLDKDGKELGAASDDKKDETKADDKKDETKADDQKDETKTESKSDEKKDDTKTVGTSADDGKKNEPSSKTGDAGAGFAIAGLAVAGAAAFVARKKH
ncbi:MAG: NPXTG-anchored protein [Oscillospiraceae bacterium]|nr:NPXTG-anchored protein [Oscillospiraceae bacterium]